MGDAPASLPAPPIRFGKIRHLKKRAFLAAFAECGNVSESAKAAGIHRDTHKNWRDADPEYVRAFADATECAIDVLETAARCRAVDGVRKPVLFQGEQVVIDEQPLIEFAYSDTLLIFLLKGLRPDKYRERYEVTGKGGEPLGVAAIRADVQIIIADPALAQAAGQFSERLLGSEGKVEVKVLPGGGTDGNGNGRAAP